MRYDFWHQQNPKEYFQVISHYTSKNESENKTVGVFACLNNVLQKNKFSYCLGSIDIRSLQYFNFFYIQHAIRNNCWKYYKQTLTLKFERYISFVKHCIVLE